MVGPSDRGEIRRDRLGKLVMVMIVVLLAAITGALINRVENEIAKKDRARDDVKAWASAVERFKLKYGDYPSTLEMLTEVQADLYDPWGREYQYVPPQRRPSHGPEIWSWGPRPNDANSSVIGNWK